MNRHEDLFIDHQLAQADLEAYAEQGYLALGRVLTDEGLAQMCEQCMAAWQAEKGVFDPDKSWLQNALLGDIHHPSEVVRKYYFDGPLVDIAKRLIGPNIKGATSQLTFKMRGNTKPFGWHQDNGYGELDPYNTLSTLTALDNADEENGCLWIIHAKGTPNRTLPTNGLWSRQICLLSEIVGNLGMAKDRFCVKGQVVLVTGAARGNGKAIAEGFLDAGAVVFFLDILEQVKKTVEALKNDRARAIVCDLKDSSQVIKNLDMIIDHHQRIDVLVNNAAVMQKGDEPYSNEIWEAILGVNLNATFALTRLVLKHMVEAQSGAIINITSPAAELAFSQCPAYSASKAAVRQLTKSIAKDYARCNIRANNVCPGYMETAMTQESRSDPKLKKVRSDRIMLDRWGKPEDLVGPCIFLASPAAAYITGCDLYVDGGLIANAV